MKKKITIIGRGVNPVQHLSIEALRALREADIVLGIEPEKSGWQKLQEEFSLPQIIDIAQLYQDGALDQDNYMRYIEAAFEILKENEKVALLVAGHPRLGVTFAQIIRSHPLATDTEIHVIAGLSSFDIMINDLELDPLERGTSILDANRLLLFRYKLEPALNYFIYHICSIGTRRTNFKDPSQENHITDLQSYLECFYSGEKQIYLCRASNLCSESAQYQRIRLSSLSEVIDDIDFSTTLYIPAETPQTIDRNFLSKLEYPYENA